MLVMLGAISAQLFDKMNVIPYAIRQFCKCLYQHCKLKFGESKITTPSAQDALTFDCEIIKVVASFLLERWILHSVFINLHIEGLVRDYILPRNCILNL